MHSPATPISVPSVWGKQKAIVTYTSVNIENRSSLSHSKSLFSTKLSDKNFRSISSSGEFVSPYSVKGTISFASIHRDIIGVQTSLLSPYTQKTSTSSGIPFPGTGGTEPPYTPPTGELDPDQASPIGDVLLPLLLMAAIYAIRRFFRNRKHIQSAK